MSLQDIDFNQLEFNEIGSWPLSMRIMAFIIIGIITIVGNYFLFIENQITSFDIQHDMQVTLRTEFRNKYHKAANLNAYKNQTGEMKYTLQKVLQQLPTEGQVPSLMEGISLQATTAGLEFNLIKPGEKINKEFYTELPIKMSIIGSYHGFGIFMAGLAKLQRIVTLHDFVIKLNTKNTDSDKERERNLIMELEAKTYWCANKEDL